MFRSGFSIASGMLLTAVIAVWVAAARMGVMHGLRDWEAAVTLAGIAGLVLGGIVGIVVAVGFHPRPAAVAVGLPVGMVAGTLAGLFSVMPASLPVLAVGGLVLIAFAGAVRGLSKRHDGDS